MLNNLSISSPTLTSMLIAVKCLEFSIHQLTKSIFKIFIKPVSGVSVNNEMFSLMVVMRKNEILISEAGRRLLLIRIGFMTNVKVYLFLQKEIICRIFWLLRLIYICENIL